MTKGKVVIVALIVLGLLFVLGLGTNLVPKKGEKKDPDEYDRSGWTGSVDKLLGRFSPRLDRRRLQRPDAGVECRRNEDILEFTGNAACALAIKPLLPGCDDDYQSTTLTLAKGGPATRDVRMKLKMKPAISIQARPLSLAGPKLKVTYQPDGKSAETVDLQGNDEIRLVVLKNGGTLTLKCTTGCSESQPVKVILESRASCS